MLSKEAAWADQFGQDLRYALRGFRRSPGFFAAAVGTLALGIGVTSTIVTLIYGLFLRPLPAPDPERLVNVHVRTRGEGTRSSFGSQYFVTWNEFQRLRAESRTAELAGMAEIRVSLRGFSERPLGTLLASCNLPGLLGARPAAGRFFTPEECAQADGAPVVVLSHAFWKARYGGDPGIVGRTMNLNRVLFTVIGVAGEEVRAPVMLQPDIWIPITMQGITAPERQFLRERSAAWVQVMGRLKPGETVETAEAELTPLAQRAVHEHAPKRTAETTVRRAALMTFPDVISAGKVVMAILTGAGMLILLLGCANVANLLLARGLNRGRELAVRMAVGAGTGRLVRQLLTESIVLASAAGVAGLAMAYAMGWVLRGALGRLIAPFAGRAELNLQFKPDPRMMLLALGLAVMTGVVFGLAPALQARGVNAGLGLHGGGTTTLTRRRAWLQGSLVAMQVAACAVLLLNSLLLVRGLHAVTTLDPGMARENVLVASFDLRQQQYTPERAQAMLEGLAEEGGALAGVERSAASSMQPYLGLNTTAVNTKEREARSEPAVRVVNHEVSETYLEAMSVPLRAGRMFTEAERRSSARVVLVSDDFARAAFGSGNPLGQRIAMAFPGAEEMEIIGVTGAVRGLETRREPFPAIFHPLRGPRWMESSLVFKYRGEGGTLAGRIRELAAKRDPELNVRIARIEDNAASAMMASRMAAGFAAALAGLALLLACSGIAGVVAFSVERRRREVGIRMALGSSPGGAVGLMMQRGLVPVFIGMAVGAAGAFAVARLMEAMLFGVKPADPVSAACGAALLVGVGALAAWLPARDAARVDPALVLRAE